MQELQRLDLAGRKKIYEEIMALDKQIDQDQQIIKTVRDKETRGKMMEDVIAFKQQIATIYSVTKRDVQERLDNFTLAQLNDLAYKAVRSGKQKKLDERAIKNEEMFKKLDLQLAAAHRKIDFAALSKDAKVT